MRAMSRMRGNCSRCAEANSSAGNGVIFGGKSQGSYCTLYGHTGFVNSVAFSPDGKRLASALR